MIHFNLVCSRHVYDMSIKYRWSCAPGSI